ncbi:hypothetical protein B7494_g1220 [Chlorociboria aeruginascens]|nr:hypothetical protein B7494_g1220 [Chlorociboria aeruginascens]
MVTRPRPSSKHEATTPSKRQHHNVFQATHPRMENLKKTPKLVKLDGRAGEGGGQLVRVAICLAALTGTPLQIANVRGKRPGKRAGGLRAQHVAAIKWLAEATTAQTAGCFVGSKTIGFYPTLPPLWLANRNIKVKAESAASILLVFQAIMPVLLFAGGEAGSPIIVSIQGGTNASFSPSFEYVDQVLLPALERFGIHIERKIKKRGWSQGTPSLGEAEFKLLPLSPSQTITAPIWPTEQGKITKIDISVIVPLHLQDPLKTQLISQLAMFFPDVETNFLLVEDATGIYILLVAHTSTSLRFGRDWLYDRKTKGRAAEEIGAEIARKVVGELDGEIRKGGLVDEYLQDQLIVYQALAEGRSIIPGERDAVISNKERLDSTDEPFGHGSLHATTARWVTSELLPSVEWFDKGRMCKGIGWRSSPA